MILNRDRATLRIVEEASGLATIDSANMHACLIACPFGDCKLRYHAAGRSADRRLSR